MGGEELSLPRQPLGFGGPCTCTRVRGWALLWLFPHSRMSLPAHTPWAAGLGLGLRRPQAQGVKRGGEGGVGVLRIRLERPSWGPVLPGLVCQTVMGSAVDQQVMGVVQDVSSQTSAVGRDPGALQRRHLLTAWMWISRGSGRALFPSPGVRMVIAPVLSRGERRERGCWGSAR